MFNVVREVPDGHFDLAVEDFLPLEVGEDVLHGPDGVRGRLLHGRCEGTVTAERNKGNETIFLDIWANDCFFSKFRFFLFFTGGPPVIISGNRT